MTDARTNDHDLHRQRLLNVARALRESSRPEKFDMTEVIHPCGTPACAFGHYVSRTDLQDFVKPERCTFQDTGRQFWRPVFVDDGAHASFYGRRVQEHFGLTREEQHALFDGGGCGEAETANQAAEYIERFVERKYVLSAAQIVKAMRAATEALQ
jgi:hypothetical protein